MTNETTSRTPVIAAQGHDGKPVIIADARHIELTGDEPSQSTCPHCGARWPEHLQYEHDMLEVTTFGIAPDGTIGAYPGEPNYLDNNAWFCAACLTDVSARVPDDLKDDLLEAIENL